MKIKVIKNHKKFTKNEFIQRSKMPFFKYQLFHDLNNSKSVSITLNHLNYLKDNIFECFFK